MTHSSGFPIYALNLGPQEKKKPLNFTSPFHALFDQLRLRSSSTGNFMAQSSSVESDLFSIFTDLFFEKPKPQSQPKPKSTPSQRQDELVKKFPGSKIIRRPNPMEEADDSTYIKFPEHDCGNYMERFYEAARLYGKDCRIDKTSCLYQRIIRKSYGIEVYYPADKLKI